MKLPTEAGMLAREPLCHAYTKRTARIRQKEKRVFLRHASTHEKRGRDTHLGLANGTDTPSPLWGSFVTPEGLSQRRPG